MIQLSLSRGLGSARHNVDVARINLSILIQSFQQQQIEASREQHIGATSPTTGIHQDPRIEAAVKVVNDAVDIVTGLKAVLEVFEEQARRLADRSSGSGEG